MFHLAGASGDVEVIGSRADELAAETGKPDKAAKAAEKAAAKAEAEAKAKVEAEAEAEAAAKFGLLNKQCHHRPPSETRNR
jgi:membrane protein involved in colicin uptake